MAEQISFKERVRQILISYSRQYKYYYTDYEYLLCSPAFKKNQYYIVTAEEDNFLHLTGVYSHISAQNFFDKCYNGTLAEADFDVSGSHNGHDVKGSVRRKINVMPNIFGMFSSSAMVQEDFQKNRISCSFAASGITCTMGFAGASAAHPKTLLKGNELDPEKSSNLVIVLRRSAGKDKFGEVLVGGTDELIKYYDHLKPLLSDKLVTQLDKEIKKRKKAAEEEAAKKESASDKESAEKMATEIASTDKRNNEDAVSQTEARKTTDSPAGESEMLEKQSDNCAQSEIDKKTGE